MRWLRLVPVLTVALTVTGLAAVPAGALRTPAGSASWAAPPGSTTSVVVVLIDTLTPLAPKPADTLHIAGRLLNTGDSAVSDISLQVRFGPVLSRFDLHRLRATPQTPSGFAGPLLTGPSALSPHGSGKFTLDLLVSRFPYLDADGVHALRIEVHGTVGTATNIEVGDGDTFLPVFATPPLAPTRIAWVVPVVAPPSLAADGALRDNGLLTDLAAHGRLSRILAAAAPVPGGTGRPGAARKPPVSTPVTWAVDPMTVQVADLVATRSYRLHAENGIRTSPADPAAARWLARLRAVLTARNVLTLPYADVDIVGLVANNQGSTVVDAIDRGRAATAAALGIRGRTTVCWPAYGVLSQPAADLLAGHGINTVLLAEPAMPPTSDLTYTATAASQLNAAGKTLTADVADADVSALVGAGTARAATPRMAEQLFLAETAMITSQRPSSSQDLLVLPPRNWDPGTQYGKAVLADSSRVPWLTSVALDDLAGDPQDSGARQPLTYPPASNVTIVAGPLPDPLPADLIASVTGTRASVRDLATVLSAPATTSGALAEAAVTAAVEDALFGAESAAWRVDLGNGYALAQDADGATQHLRGSVRAAAARVVTLTSATSPIPVTVVNDLPVEVHVILSIEAPNRAKLANSYREPVTLPAGAKLRFNVPVRVESGGTFALRVSVLTPSGRSLGTPMQFIIRSAAYGRAALILTFGALGLLVVAIVLRTVRRIRRRSS